MNTCEIAGCDREQLAKGLCSGHYARRRHQRPLAGPIQRRNDRAATLAERVAALPTTTTETGCVLVLTTTHPRGYGRIGYQGQTLGAHVAAWMIANDETVPPSGFICHHCDQPACINAEHLYLGDAITNARDMAERGRCANQWTSKAATQ